jgi:hypothetical protein
VRGRKTSEILYEDISYADETYGDVTYDAPPPHSIILDGEANNGREGAADPRHVSASW